MPAGYLQPAWPRLLSASCNPCLAPPSVGFRSGLSALRDCPPRHHQADAAKHHKAHATQMSHILRNEPSIPPPPELPGAQRRGLTHLQPQLLPACFVSRPFTSEHNQGAMASFLAHQSACWGPSNQAQLRPASKALPGTREPSQPVRPRHTLPAAMVSRQDTQACRKGHSCQNSSSQLLPATFHQRPSSSQSDVPQPTPSAASRARLRKLAAELCASASLLPAQGPPQAVAHATPLRCTPSFSQAQGPASPYHKPARTSASLQKGPSVSGGSTSTTGTGSLHPLADCAAGHNAQQAGEAWHESSIPVTSQAEPVAGASTAPGVFAHHPIQHGTPLELPNASPASQAWLPGAAQYVMQLSDPVGSLQKSACDAHVVPMLADNSNAAYRRPSNVAASPRNATQAWLLGTDSVLHGCSQNLPPSSKRSHRAASTMGPQNDAPLPLGSSAPLKLPSQAAKSSDVNRPAASKRRFIRRRLVRSRFSSGSGSTSSPDNPSQQWTQDRENVLQDRPESLGPPQMHERTPSPQFLALASHLAPTASDPRCSSERMSVSQATLLAGHQNGARSAPAPCPASHRQNYCLWQGLPYRQELSCTFPPSLGHPQHPPTRPLPAKLGCLRQLSAR